VIILAVVIAILAVILLAGALILWLGGGSTAAPPPPPTEAPPPEACSVYKTTGIILAGTSGDYPPFEYYGDDYRLTGFDVDLMRAIAEKMGKQVDIADMAFDGLGTAVQIGQIDVAVAAISVTEQRSQQFLFSDVYLVSQAGVLAKDDSTVGDLTSPAQLADKRTGVQTASVYEGWIQNTLVEPGLMPAANLFSYPRIDQALEDLRQGRLDVVVLDYAPALSYASQGGLRLAGTGGSQQLYALMLKPCATELQAEINAALIQLANEGVIARLSEKYLGLTPDSIQPTPTPAPAPTATVVGPTPTPDGYCVSGMDFVKDLNYYDNNMQDPPEVKPGERFQKGWRLRNVGSCNWNPKYYMAPSGGNSMSGSPTYVVGTVEPGQTYDMYVDLEAPDEPGTYMGLWSLFEPSNQALGDRVWVGIEVIPENVATATPVPGKPKIETFTVDPAAVPLGQCFTLNWSVSGKVDTVNLARGSEVFWKNAPLKGTTQDCPASAGAVTYAIEAAGPGGSVKAERQVQVSQGGPPTATAAPATATSEPPTATPAPPFDGAAYDLAQMMDPSPGQLQPVLAGTQIDLRLYPNLTFEGSSGCNTYRGEYQVQGNEIRLSVGPITQLYCADPAGTMEQEAAYLSLLGSVTRYRHESPSLYLLAPGETQDQVVMEYSRR
jgi:ABC-type amino acid transport substrate-binding protein